MYRQQRELILQYSILYKTTQTYQEVWLFYSRLSL